MLTKSFRLDDEEKKINLKNAVKQLKTVTKIPG